MECIVDSGAFRTVGPKEVAEEVPIEVTAGAKEGETFTAANGSPIKYYGNRKLQGVEDDGMPIAMEIAVADVRKVLASVGAMCDAGNRVIFEKHGGVIYSLKTGRKLKMPRKACGNYTFNTWMKKGETRGRKTTGGSSGMRTEEHRGRV